MKTYEELLEVGEDDKARGEFCLAAIREFENSQAYKDAYTATRYYNKHNVTIETFEKWMYTVTGRQVKDVYSSNHRVQTHHFRRMVIQQANYLLGKGIQLDDQAKKDKLGKKFDYNLIKAAKYAMVEGVSYGFWNANKMEVFGICCTNQHPGFCPLESAENDELMGGISFKYKKVGRENVAYITLYEPEGQTKYIKKSGEDIKLKEARRPYKIHRNRTKAEGIVDMYAEGYGGKLPIVPLYASDTMESELIGLREAVDTYDLIKSGLADNIDDASEIYWIVQNVGGMDDPDLAQFLQRLKRTKVVDVDAQSGGGASAHTVDVPVEARKVMLEILRTDLYDDMMLLDRRSMSAAQKTTQELDMAYQTQDEKVDDLEFYVMEFVENIMALAGIESEIRFERGKVVNKTETVASVLSAANFLSPECVIRHLSFLSPEEMEEEVEKLNERSMEQFGILNKDEDDEDEEDEEEE